MLLISKLAFEQLKETPDSLLQGNTREVLHKFTVDLPKKHGRGGQSALRFARLRMEKRHNYVRKVAEVATQLFITNDKPNIAGLILAGSADFKTELSQSDMFDPVSISIFFPFCVKPKFFFIILCRDCNQKL